MYMEILTACAVLIFAIIAIFLVRTLISLRKTIININQLLVDMSSKTADLDPLFRTISNVTQLSEYKTNQLKKEFYEKEQQKQFAHEPAEFPVADFAEWIALSVYLGKKILGRKKHEK